MTKDATLTIRLAQELRDAINAAAAKEDRSVSQFVERHMRAIVMPKRKGKVASRSADSPEHAAPKG